MRSWESCRTALWRSSTCASSTCHAQRTARASTHFMAGAALSLHSEHGSRGRSIGMMTEITPDPSHERVTPASFATPERPSLSPFAGAAGGAGGAGPEGFVALLDAEIAAPGAAKGTTWLETLGGFWMKINNDWIFNLAGLLAYNFLMALFPLFLLLLAGAGVALQRISPGTDQQLQRTLAAALPGST